MNKEQVFEILSHIKLFYERFEVTQEKLNAWHNILEDEDFNAVYSILKGVVKTNKFPPTIAEILPSKQLNGVMSVEKTKEHLDKLKRDEEEMAQGEKLDFPRDYKAFKKFMEERKGEE
jgi:hypothetical protein